MAKILSVRASGQPVVPPASAPKSEKTTQAQWGPKLLIGVEGRDGSRDRRVDFKAWNLKAELNAADFRGMKKHANQADVVLRVLSSFVTRWGHHDMEALKQDERIAILEQSWLADVLYAWVLLRMKAIGSVATVQITCPNCDHKMDVDLDLSDVDLEVAPDGCEIRSKRALRDGFLLPKSSPWGRMEGLGGKIMSLTLQPARWKAFDLVRKDQILKPMETKAAMLTASICGAESVDGISLSIDDVAEMSKVDFELASESGFGYRPILDFELDCPQCRTHMHDVPVPWDYGSFFSAKPSSL